MPGRSDADFEADREFEIEVLRVARLLYPDAIGGAQMVGGQERDGILVGRDVALALEATRSRTVQKVEKDARKLNQIVTRLAREHPTKLIRGFIVTAEEPTADQRDRTRRYGGDLVAILGMSEFRRRLFDAYQYLTARDSYAFGSARDLRTNGVRVTAEFVPIDLLVKPELSQAISAKTFADRLTQGVRATITGDFGIGKSMFLREVYRILSRTFRADPAAPVPIHLNLRDHRGQDDPSEALHRHSKRIGFSNPDDVVRAWRSGEVVLLLDGFDEITYPGWSGRVASLSDVRRLNVALVRRFLADTPPEVGLVVAGRAHFFDSDAEMMRSLGVDERALRLSASDFDSAQVDRFLRSNGLDVHVPEWLPKRPLLLGYLALNGFLGRDASGEQASPAAGWDILLDKISEREAEMEVGVDGSLVRRILERAATHARRTSSGRGPLRFDQLTSAFFDVCGFEPDEGSRVILDRLPGLGASVGMGEADRPREFVDDDFVDVARAGDVVEFVRSPHQFDFGAVDVRSWSTLLGDLGVQVALNRLEQWSLGSAAVEVALDHAEGRYPDMGIAVEVFRLVATLGGSKKLRTSFFSNHILPSLHLQSLSEFSGVVFSDCIIERLEVEVRSDSWERMPVFREVAIEAVDGLSGASELSAANFIDCKVGKFEDSAENTSEILGLRLSDEAKVVLILLKKLYRQRGSGRKDSALRRGGLSQTQQGLVDPILSRLTSEGLVTRGRAGGTHLWLPVAGARKRAMQLLASPLTSSDPVMTRR